MVEGIRIRQLTESEYVTGVRAFADMAYSQLDPHSVALARRQKSRVDRWAFSLDDTDVGMAIVRCTRVPFLSSGVAYISSAPLTRCGPDQDLDRLRGCLMALRTEYCDVRNYILQVRLPVVPKTLQPEIVELVTDLGFDHLQTESQSETLLVDLTPEESEIRDRLHRKWRRNLRLSEKEELELVIGHEASLFEEFCEMYSSMIDRKSFSTQVDARFYANLQEVLPPEDKLQIILARKEGKPAAGVVVSSLGDTTVFVLGASNDLGRDTRASYLLHWKALTFAREQNYQWYDLNGIDNESNPGVTTFKLGLGHEPAVWPGLFQCVPRSLRAKLVVQLLRLRKRMKK